MNIKQFFLGTSLKNKLDRSIYLISGFSISMLIVTLILITWLGFNAVELATKNAPKVNYTEKLLRLNQ